MVLEGTGSVWVQVVDSLHVTLTGTGSVYYYGDPFVTGSAGTGSIIKM